MAWENLPSTNTPLEATNLLNNVYPVGSIYMSVNNTSPTTLFGGTWQQIKDTFLLSAGDTYTAGNTGGASTHIHTSGIGTGGTNIVLDTVNHQTTTSRLSFNSVPAVQFSNTSGVDYYDEINTGSANNMPPYLVIYMWKRTA